jgi:hydrogenase-4 component E
MLRSPLNVQLLSHLDVELLKLLAAGMLLISFAMLSTRRTQQLITLFAWQGAILFLSTTLIAHEARLTELYFSAGLTLILKVITLPLI